MRRPRLLTGFLLAAAGAATLLLVHGLGSRSTSGPTRHPSPADSIAGARLRGARPLAFEALPPDAASSRISGRVLRGRVGVEAVVEIGRLAAVARSYPADLPLRPPMPSGRDLLPGVGRQGREARARCGRDGRFSVRVPGAGVYGVTARTHDGLAVRRDVGVPGQGAEVSVILTLPDGEETLRGSVAYEDGRAFVGHVFVERGRASRTQWGGRTPEVWAVQTDASGRFAASGLPRGSLALTVLDPGRLRFANVPVVLPHAEELRIIVPCATTLGGRIVDAETHAPLAGAQVTAVGYAWTGRTVLVHGRTNAQGAFRLAGPVLHATLAVEARGYEPLARSWDAVPSEALVLGLRRGVSLCGRLVAEDSGRPVVGVPVFALTRDPYLGDPDGGFLPSPVHYCPQRSPHVARSDEEGRFVLAGVPVGMATVFAIGGGWVSANVTGEGATSRPARQVQVEAEATEELVLLMRPAGRLAVEVRDAQGEPVTGAHVSLRNCDLAAAGARLDLGAALAERSRAATDEHGTCVLHALVPGTRQYVVVRSDGHETAYRDVPVSASGDDAAMQVVLPDGRWIDVLVVSSGGEPLPGATIHLRERAGPGATWRRARVGTTGRDGRTRIGPVTRERIELCALPADAQGDRRIQSGGWSAFPAAAEDAPTHVRIEVAGGHALAGHVTGPEGAPLEQVALTIDPWDWPRTVKLVAVASDGSWAVPGGLEEPPHGVYAMLHWQGRLYWGEASAGEEETDVVVPLIQTDVFPLLPGGTRTVRVLDQAGRPAVYGWAALVTCTRFGGFELQFGSRPVRLDTGRATFGGFLRPPAYVEVWGVPGPAGGGGRFGPLPEGGECEVRLTEACTIEGVVRDSAHRPVGDVQVRAETHPAAEHGDGRRAVAVTDEDGRFVLRGLGALEYALHVHVSATHDLVPPLVVRGGARDVEIVLARSLTVELTVLGEGGRPVAGGRVVAQAVRPEAHIRKEVFARIDDRGVARLCGLDADTHYALEVTPPEEGEEPLLPFETAGWVPRSETIRLARSLNIAGRVLDLSDRPFEAAQVHCWQKGFRLPLEAVSAEDGSFSFAGLRAGRYRVWAQVGDVSAAKYAGSQVLDVAAGAERIVLRLEAGGEITVHLEGWPEGALEAELHAEPPHPHWALTIESPDARVFRFRGLASEASYTLWIQPAWHAGHEDTYVFERHLSAGDSVTVHARQSPGLSGRLLFPSDVNIYSSSISANVHGIRIHGDQNTRHEFEIPGVPPGTYRIQASIRTREGVDWRGEGVASPGAPIDVTMEVVAK